MKFDEKIWGKIFDDISYVRFVTKVDVMNDCTRIVELNNDGYIMTVFYHSIKNNYGYEVFNEVKRLMGDVDAGYNIDDMIYVKCDELKIAFKCLNEMGKELERLKITNLKGVSSALYYRYRKYGKSFNFEGYEFLVVTIDDIYKKGE